MGALPGLVFWGDRGGIPPRGAVSLAEERSDMAFLPVLVDGGDAEVAHPGLASRLQKQLGCFHFTAADDTSKRMAGNFLDGFQIEPGVRTEFSNLLWYS